jgi:DNA-binding protein YbaB
MAKFGNFDQLMKKAATAAEKIAEKSMEFAKATAEGAKNLSMVAKLNAEILGEKDNIRKAQMKIGKRYYELYKDNPAEELAEFCIKIDCAKETILEKQEQIKAIKAEMASRGEAVDAETEPAAEDSDDDIVSIEIEIIKEEPADFAEATAPLEDKPEDENKE